MSSAMNALGPAMNAHTLGLSGAGNSPERAAHSQRTAFYKTPRVAYALCTLCVAFVCAVLLVAGSSRWLPQGSAGVDHIVLPIVLFPLIWVVLALTLFTARRRMRAWTLIGTLTALQGAWIIQGFLA